MACVSQKKYAEHRGVSRQYINSLIKKGLIPESATKRIGRQIQINIEKADAALKKNLSQINRKKRGGARPGAGKPGTGAVKHSGMTFEKARTQHEIIKAAHAELNYETALKKYIRVDEVEEIAFESARSIRDKLESIADRVAPLVAASSSTSKCRDIIESEIRNILEELVNALQIQQ